MLGRVGRFLETATPFVALIALWQVATMLRLWPPAFLPDPFSVYTTGANLVINEALVSDVMRTVARVGVGAAIGLTAGVLLAMIFALIPRLWEEFEDVVNFMQAVGEIGWLPVFALWVGFNERAIAMTITYTVFFPVFFGTYSGFRSVPQNLIGSVRTLGGDRRRVLTQVLLPGAMPGIITGLRTGMGFGWRSVILAEFIIAQTGLGVMLQRGRQFFRTDMILVGMIVAGVLWLVTDRFLLQPVEKRTIDRWGIQRKAA